MLRERLVTDLHFSHCLIDLPCGGGFLVSSADCRFYGAPRQFPRLRHFSVISHGVGVLREKLVFYSWISHRPSNLPLHFCSIAPKKRNGITVFVNDETVQAA